MIGSRQTSAFVLSEVEGRLRGGRDTPFDYAQDEQGVGRE